MKTKRIANMKRDFLVGSETFLEEATAFIRDALARLGTAKKLALKAELLSEETIIQFAEHAPEDAVLQVRIKRFLGDSSVTFTMPGEEFDPCAPGEEESEEAIRAILFRSYGELFKYSHKNHVNRARILTGQSGQTTLYATLAAIALGLLFGLLAKFVLPAPATEAVCGYLLNPVKTMFMNALKIVIAPVIFFSIVTCISQFHSLSELGRLGAKVMGMYLLTTVIAVSLGIGFSRLLHPGQWGFALSAGHETAAIVDANMDTSLRTMIVGIVPSNLVQPFLEANALQIIFLAVLCGVAVGMIGEYSTVLKELFEACNSLFLTITTMIARLIPVAVFASVSLLVVDTGKDSLLSVLGVTGTQILTIGFMICAYGLLILAVGRLNPTSFFKKNGEGMLTSFMLSSSSAAMPTNLKICTDKLGISPRVCNFSIPLGATVNMDGASITLSVVGLFLARAYGVEVTGAAIFSLAVTIILLSVGAPGVPGAGLICTGVVLKVLNVPLEAMELIIAIYPIMDMFSTMSNTTGDMATALIVARSEKLLDEKKYYGSV